MIGRLYIDGIDAYERYGVLVVEGGYSALVSYPPLKKVASISWPEEDGIDADLLNPVLDTREFAVNFGSVNSDLTGDMIALLSDGAYHEFDFREIGKSFRLRLVSQPNKDVLRRLEKFSLQFADDFPLMDYTYTAPLEMPDVKIQGFEIDDIDFSTYGVHILEGSDVGILKSPAVKKNLLTNIGSKSGAIYDGEYVVYEAKDVALKCFLRADNAVIFWRNYNALLFDLIQPDERIMYVESIGYECACHYKSSTVTEFDIVRGKIWCKFSLSFVFTDFRVIANETILMTEEGEWVISEDENSTINLNEIR